MTTFDQETTCLWERLPQSLDITPDRVVKITALRGQPIENMVTYLNVKFPGILSDLADRYTDQVLQHIPRSVVSRTEVLGYVDFVREVFDQQTVRDLAVDFFLAKVNSHSPEWAKRAMMGLVEFGLGNYCESLHQTGFARCEFIEPRFPQMMRGTGYDSLELLLMTERDKANILTQMLTEHRVRN